MTQVGKCLRIDAILWFAFRMHLDFLCLQEPHTNTPEKLAQVTENFRIRGYELLCPITAEGRGGAAIAVKDTWNVISFVEHSHRVLQASVSNGEGDVPSIASLHMHQRCSIRSSQWGHLLRDQYSLPADSLIFGDFNSVILPARDIGDPQARSQGAPSHAAADRPRRLELEFIGKKGLLNAYAVVHGHEANRGVLGGWSWGFHRAPAVDSGRPAKKKPRVDPPSVAPQDRRRRIDRILIPDRLCENVSAYYPHFLANSDHKALVITLCPWGYCPPHKRKRCPTSFLSCKAMVEAIKEHVKHVPRDSSGTTWWSVAQAIIRCQAHQFKSAQCTMGRSEVKVYILDSSRQRVIERGWNLLRDTGINPPTHFAANSALCLLLDEEVSDRSGLLVLDKIKQALADPYEHSPGNRKKEIWCLTKHLQPRNRLLRLTNQTSVLTDPESIAKEINSFLSGIMNNGGAQEAACPAYLDEFFGKKNMPDIG